MLSFYISHRCQQWISQHSFPCYNSQRLLVKMTNPALLRTLRNRVFTTRFAATPPSSCACEILPITTQIELFIQNQHYTAGTGKKQVTTKWSWNGWRKESKWIHTANKDEGHAADLIYLKKATNYQKGYEVISKAILERTKGMRTQYDTGSMFTISILVASTCS